MNIHEKARLERERGRSDLLALAREHSTWISEKLDANEIEGALIQAQLITKWIQSIFDYDKAASGLRLSSCDAYDVLTAEQRTELHPLTNGEKLP
jgi:hypothetical protein